MSCVLAPRSGTLGNEDTLEADTRQATPRPGVAAPQAEEPCEPGSSLWGCPAV